MLYLASLFALVVGKSVGSPPCFSTGVCTFDELSDGTLGFTIVPSSSPVSSSAGDINKDGLSDLLISGSSVDGAGVGYVVFGSSDPSHWIGGHVFVNQYVDGSNGFVINGEFLDGMGMSSRGLGDINGDGIDDFAIGAPWSKHQPDSPHGRVYVIFGTKDRTAWGEGNLSISQLVDGIRGFQLVSDSTDGYFGFGLASAGDINGDGVGDMVFGDPLYSLYAGRTFVIFGSRDPKHWGDGKISRNLLSDGVHGVTFSADILEATGNSVAGGDVNGDGIDDLVIGGPGVERGQVWVIWGTDAAAFWKKGAFQLSDFQDGKYGIRLVSLLGEYAGSSVCLGDVNGDGLADILAGDPGGDESLAYSRMWVIFGSKDPSVWRNGTLEALDDGVHGFSLVAEESPRSVGFTVDTGDVNGDGIADVALSAWDNVTTGRTYVVFGSRETSIWGTGNLPLRKLRDGVRGYMLLSNTREYQSGSTLSTTGDINGDGIRDLIVGSTNPNNNAGAFVHVVFGWATKK